MKFLSKRTLIQFVKFAVVGATNTLVDWLVFFALVKWLDFFQTANHEVVAKIISFIVAVTNSFIWNSLWTFRQEYQEGLAKGERRTIGTIYFSRFLAVSIVGLVINTLVFALARPIFSSIFSKINMAQLASLVTATAVVLIWNFLANKFWTYKIKEGTAAEIKKNRLVYLAVGILLGAMFFISFLTMRNDSAIVDEVAHIPAGYSYLEKRDLRMNPEHPPLAKAISGIPLTFLQIEKPFVDWSWNAINQWEFGWDFLYRMGNNADLLIFWSRLPMLFLTLLTGLMLFIWARKLFGVKTALFILALFVFCPNILAHSHWVTTDIAATFAFLSGIYFFDKYIQTPTRKNLIIAGLIFGVVQLLKFSAVLLIPIFGIYIISWAVLKRKEESFWRSFGKNIWALVQILIIGYAVVWAVYLVLYSNTPLDIEEKLIDLSLPTAGMAPINHILKYLAGIPIISALSHYLLGFIMVFAHTEGGHTSFLLGKFSQYGFKSYFPLAFLFKVSLPVLLLLFASLIPLFIRKFKDQKDVWLVIVFLTMPVIYFAFSIKGNLNIGIRHLLPTFPFFFLLIGRFVQPFLQAAKWSWQKVIILLLGLWLVVESLVVFPNYMAYFNELRYVFGLKKHQILIDSNLDWGQDLKRLANFCQKNNISEIKIDYFGGGVPSYYIPGAMEWHSKYGRASGWLAVSATFYQMSKYFGPKEGLPDYSYLDHIKPVAVIGDSILVYHLE